MKFERIGLIFFAWLYAAGVGAAIAGAAWGYTWHLYTAIMCAIVSVVLFNELLKLKKKTAPWKPK